MALNIELNTKNSILKTENIDKFFHDPTEFQVLKNIEFEVQKGEFLSMIGKSGSGKSGGVRVIYYNQLTNGHIWLLTIYSKNVRDTLDASILRQLKERLDASIAPRT